MPSINPLHPEWGMRYLPREIAVLAYNAGWIDAQRLLEAISVVLAESNGYEHRRGPINPDGSIGNPDGSIDRGLWQINNVIHASVPDSVCDDAVLSTKYARKLYDSSKWQSWSSFANGRYREAHAMGYAFDGVANFLRIKNGFPV